MFSSYNGSMRFLFVSENLAMVLLVFATAFIKAGSTVGIFSQLEFNLGKAAFVAIVVQVCLYFYDLYDHKQHASRYELARRLAGALLVATLFLGLAYTVFPRLMLTPGIWLWNTTAALVALYMWRVWYEKINSIPAFGSSVLIVGTGELANAISNEIQQDPALGIQLRGFLADRDEDIGATINGRRVLGNWDDLESIITRHNVTHLVIAMSDRRGKLPVETLLNLKLAGISVEEGASLYEQITGKLPVDQLNPSYLVFSSGCRTTKATIIYQRAFSIIFSIIGLILSAPLMLLTAIAIKLESRGPVFFRQERVGKNGKIFKLIKFRSMSVDAEARSGPVWAQQNDPRVTRVGKFIRRTRIDELPQFINVLKGDMNFVGPRPERPFFVEQLRTVIPYYWQRHTIAPGLTGWAQVMYPYGATIEDSREKLKFDLFYIKNLSIFLDLSIIFQTIKIVLLGRGAR
jgi:sugar transferase (PEP-CTERM system associated)